MTNIVTALNEGRVTFSYTKADGSTRKATGTTNMSLIPTTSQVPNPNTDTEARQVKYYDLDSNGWRTFTRSSLNESSIQVEAATA